MLDPSSIRALTFDCYGTLIDWERGILSAIQPVFRAHNVRMEDAETLRLYAEFEAREEHAPYQSYRRVLQGVMGQIARHLALRLSAHELDCLGASLPSWPAWSDAPAMLKQLAARFPLVICSNIDADLFFGGTAKSLGHDDPGIDDENLGTPSLFTYVVTASLCRSYKPDPRHLRVALALLDLEPHQVLHVAQSRYHDIGPANALGFQTAWINRPSACANVGIAPAHPLGSEPDATFTDLASLTAALMPAPQD